MQLFQGISKDTMLIPPILLVTLKTPIYALVAAALGSPLPLMPAPSHPSDLL
jgi:hypothetical protein